MASWRNGRYEETNPSWRNSRRWGLKNPCPGGRAGATPVGGTKREIKFSRFFVMSTKITIQATIYNKKERYG